MAEERFCIPICKRHGMFQTGNGRWLSLSKDLAKHIEFTKSYDAILTEGECNKCIVNPNQTKMYFEPINIYFREQND